MTFSDKVKYVRMKRQLSRKDMALEIGVSAVALGRWERGEVEPRLAQLGKFYAYCEKHNIIFDDAK